MRIKVFVAFLLMISLHTFCQQKKDTLSISKIMRDPKWIGSSPSNPRWSADGKYLFFNWNPDKQDNDSLYYITVDNVVPRKADLALRKTLLAVNEVSFNRSRSAYTYSRNGDIFLVDVRTNTTRRVTETAGAETEPRFAISEKKIVYLHNQDVYAWDIATGLTTQWTNFQTGMAPKGLANDSLNRQETWLKEDQLRTFEVLRLRKQRREKAEAENRKLLNPKKPRLIYDQYKLVDLVQVSPDGRFVSFRLVDTVTGQKSTVVPNYVTEGGFTQDIAGRTKVGEAGGRSQFFVFDRLADTVLMVKPDSIPGIYDTPDYLKDYPAMDSIIKKPPLRQVTISGPYWNENGTHAVVEVRSEDNKDRWLMSLDPARASLRLLDRQRDEAWVGGPGTSQAPELNTLLWVDSTQFWYQSEVTGYSHLFTVNVNTGKKKVITSGEYEVQDVLLSNDRKHFYLRTNEVHPGEQHFYRLPVTGGKPERLTALTGANLAVISPDEKLFAFLFSSSNKPWELYLQDNHLGAKARQITFAAQSAEFKSYPWREPELVQFKASDGAGIYARLYKANHPLPSRPAVIFVHGAGYLQNAHKWWSYYYREYMFHNFLADKGYTVMDIDYRGSAGYGRNWRTGIYRHMGGKDLSDQVDAAAWLVKQQGVDSAHIGIYGGSYGGFITLMAMFTKPGVFAAGAGLRSVTDWAHYEHGYTSAILNEPFTDSLAYRRSSPIYFAEGLKGRLLMCHGMVDVNVHFQDIVRLSQRLIELGKENWELAVYPVEDHSFVEPSSWTDEYRRIFALFEASLR